MIKGMTGGKNPIEFYVDDDDSFLLRLKWHAQYDKGRLSAIVTTLRLSNGKQYPFSLHRAILRQSIGTGTTIDHRDGNPANNCKDNLRLCSHAENSWNYKKPKSNSSGYKGASYRKREGKYQAYIRKNRRFYSLGYYDTAEEAHKAYCDAAVRLFGEFARFD